MKPKNGPLSFVVLTSNWIECRIVFDIIFRGGDIIDGTGAPRVRADLVVQGDTIAFIGDARSLCASRNIDATGLVLAPGFIDCHAHDDRAVLETPHMAPKISQGVTTVINGNCGISLAPYKNTPGDPPMPLRTVEPRFRFDSFAHYLDALDANPPALNVATLVGHTSLRVRHQADLNRAATPAETEAMRAAASRALEDGAIGLSSGTFYPPAFAAPAEEIVGVGRDLKRWGGVYTSHMRTEGDGVAEAIEETAGIAKALDVPLVISHHKVTGKANFGRTRETLAQIALLQQTQPICLDCYPYTASSSLLRRERLTLCDEILITYSKTEPDAAGSNVTDLAKQWGCTREDALDRVMPGMGMFFFMDEDDVRRVLSFPATMIGSDGIPSDDYPHPRLWGTFTRLLGHYSRDTGLVPLEQMVHKMTGLTACNFGLQGRGELKVGYCADITVFDPVKVRDRATYLDPEVASEGISHVLVNGTPVWGPEGATGARPGRCLRRTGNPVTPPSH